MSSSFRDAPAALMHSIGIIRGSRTALCIRVVVREIEMERKKEKNVLD